MKGRFYIPTGKTAAGKTYIAKLLETNFGCTRIINHTSRNPRKGEVDGIDYHFVSLEEFDKMVESGNFYQHIERKDPKTGTITKYGTTYKSLSSDGDMVQVLDLDGVSDMKKYCEEFGYEMIVLNVHAEDEIRKARYDARGDSYPFEGRNLKDCKDFDMKEHLYDFRIINNYDGVESIMQLKKIIKGKLRKVIAVDFDRTLAMGYPKPRYQTLLNKLILWYCRINQKLGNIVILNTLRHGEALDEALKYLKGLDFHPDYTNRNTVEGTNKWGYARKIACDVNIDDRNIGLLGFILRVWRYNENKNK